jgi:hypothetical protein
MIRRARQHQHRDARDRTGEIRDIFTLSDDEHEMEGPPRGVDASESV